MTLLQPRRALLPVGGGPSRLPFGLEHLRRAVPAQHNLLKGLIQTYQPSSAISLVDRIYRRNAFDRSSCDPLHLTEQHPTSSGVGVPPTDSRASSNPPGRICNGGRVGLEPHLHRPTDLDIRVGVSGPGTFVLR